jgi:1-deoxy-D-xylulose-5-phosphate reductoisomerase
LNAANEIAVQAFLQEKIDFLKIPHILSYCLEHGTQISNPSYEDYVQTDEETRRLASEMTGTN